MWNLTNITGFPRWLVRQTLEWIYPSVCPGCKRRLGEFREILCTDCWNGLQTALSVPYCRRCGRDTSPYTQVEGRCPRCRKEKPKLSHLCRVGRYQEPIREIILAYKFHRQSWFDEFLGNLLAEAILGSEALRTADFLVPIPLHWRRKWVRTYNQSELLAEQAAKRLKRDGVSIPVNLDLVRMRYTPPQTTLPPEKRLVNLKHAFSARPDAPFRGKHICLIDDVTTTGTTLHYAAKALRKAGAETVSAAVIAVADNDYE